MACTNFLTLLPFITETKMEIVSYNAQRVMRQLDYDQSAIQSTREMRCSNRLIVESLFVGEGREYIVSKFQSIYWPDKLRVGLRSPGGSIYIKKSLSTMSDFVLDQPEQTLEITETDLAWNRDRFLRIKEMLGCLLSIGTG